MYAACYVLNVHCDHPGHTTGVPRNSQFTGDNKRQAFAEAAKAGWDVDTAKGTGTCVCPHCQRKP